MALPALTTPPRHAPLLPWVVGLGLLAYLLARGVSRAGFGIIPALFLTLFIVPLLIGVFVRRRALLLAIIYSLMHTAWLLYFAEHNHTHAARASLLGTREGRIMSAVLVVAALFGACWSLAPALIRGEFNEPPAKSNEPPTSP